MKEIRISPMVQLVALAAIAAAIVAAALRQTPEVQRYLKIRSM